LKCVENTSDELLVAYSIPKITHYQRPSEAEKRRG
jgi:hypothetical protein